MARNAYVKTPDLETENVGLLRVHLNGMQLMELSMCLVVYIASVLDQVAAGEPVYLTLGGTRAKDAFLLTEKGDAGNVYAGGENIIALLEQVRDKLTTDDLCAVATAIVTGPPPPQEVALNEL